MNARFSALIASSVLAIVAFFGACIFCDSSVDADVAGSGIDSDPFSELSCPASELVADLSSASSNTLYVLESCNVDIYSDSSYTVQLLTEDSGLEFFELPEGICVVNGFVTDTAHIAICDLSSFDGLDYTVVYDLILEPLPDIFLRPFDTLEVVSGDSVESFADYPGVYDVSYSEVGGTAASWLSVDSSTGAIVGTAPEVDSLTSYTYTVSVSYQSEGIDFDDEQTLSIDVYPVASIACSEDLGIIPLSLDSPVSVLLESNVPMSFSVVSGELPDGISLEGGLVYGTPATVSAVKVIVEGTSTSGPAQTAQIVLSFVDSADYPDVHPDSGDDLGLLLLVFIIVALIVIFAVGRHSSSRGHD